MYNISVFHGNQMNTEDGYIEEFEDFEELTKSKLFKCNKGKKHEAYFVRGELRPMKRNDNNLATSRLLIIDADINKDGNSAPAPKLITRKLKLMGYNHFIYTSHSHSNDVNKFRVLVPCDRDIEKHELKYNMQLILKELGNIGWVKEMGVWSQPWFFPTRDDPEDGLYESYSYFDGDEWNVKEVKAEDETSQEEEINIGQQETLGQLYANITSGKEYHESILNITWQLSKDNMSKAHIIALVQGLIAASPEFGSERAQQRFDDVERLVDDAIAKQSVEEFDLERPEDKYQKGKLPLPPGMLGDLEQACYDGLLYQYREVSLVSAIGLVAGIAGRKFNVVSTERTGLNMYMTLIASTGVGKDGINKFINNAIRKSIHDVKDASNERFTSFIGPASFTGPKAIYNAFKDARSRVCVSSEAGLLLKSKSGDMEGKQMMVLNMYNDSGSDSHTRSTVFSDEDKNIGSLRAVAATYISESTPDVLMEAYNSMGALNTGHLPRQMVFRIGKRARMNRNVKEYLPDKIGNRLHDLLSTCAQVQAEDDPQAYDMVFDDSIIDDLYDYIDKYDQIAEEFAGVDVVREKMATRVNLKAIRLAAISTVINKDKNHPKSLIIEKQEWDWAKALCDYEFDHITGSLSGMQGDQAMSNAVVAVYQKINAIVDNTISNSKCQVDVRYRKQKVIPYSKLKIACIASPSINLINDKFGKMKLGVDKVLEDMESQGAIRLLESDPLGGRSPKVVQVLPAINDYIRGYGL